MLSEIAIREWEWKAIRLFEMKWKKKLEPPRCVHSLKRGLMHCLFCLHRLQVLLRINYYGQSQYPKLNEISFSDCKNLTGGQNARIYISNVFLNIKMKHKLIFTPCLLLMSLINAKLVVVTYLGYVHTKLHYHQQIWFSSLSSKRQNDEWRKYAKKITNS